MPTNRGVAYIKPGEVQVKNIEYPKLRMPKSETDPFGGKDAPHGVILKVLTTNICGSDQHMVRGRTTAPQGLILGHAGLLLYGVGIWLVFHAFVLAYEEPTQPQALEARVTLAADDDVIVNRDAERRGGLGDLLGHLDVGARRRRVAGWVIVDEDDRRCAEFERAQGHLSSALSRLLVVGEKYPDLKANQNFMALQEEITGTEDKVSYARQFYNDTVRSLNEAIKTFPGKLFAGAAKVSAREFYEVDDPAKRAVPTVTFD